MTCIRCGAPLEQSGPLCGNCLPVQEPANWRTVNTEEKRIAAAVAGERERCAKIAENMRSASGGIIDLMRLAGEVIAGRNQGREMILRPDGKQIRRDMGFIGAFSLVRDEKMHADAIASDRIYPEDSDSNALDPETNPLSPQQRLAVDAEAKKEDAR